MADRRGHQRPMIKQVARDINKRLRIVQHPAVRLGFLDAQLGRPFNHDHIIERIQSETPATALKRIGWHVGIFSAKEIDEAQYRYEEGRLLVFKYGLKCRSWNHPDYPPKALFDFAVNRPDNDPL